jgi:hypothetical protein
MGKKLATYGAGLIGLYLVVFYSTGAGKIITTGSAGGTSVIKALQGR